MRVGIALGVVVAVASGCADDPPRGLAWDIRFEPPALADRAVAVRAEIRAGGCTAGAPVIWSAEVSRTALTGMRPPDLGRGTYGFAARARDGSCVWFGEGCTRVQLPTVTDRIGVAIGEVLDPMVGCLDAGPPDAGTRDATAPNDAPPPPPDTGPPDTGPPPDPIVDIAAGAGHSCALRASGTVLCWGRNDEGQLGDGTTTRHELPAPVTSLPPAQALMVGSTALHSCAILRDGTAMCWGRNHRGQLGDGTEAQRTTPVAVLDLTDVTQIAGGVDHTCALAAGGAPWCWGDDSRGQLARFVDGGDSRPGRIFSLPAATRIACGQQSTCAISPDGNGWCWGRGDFGQLGDGSTGGRTRPVQVGRISNLIDIAAGDTHACAIEMGGDLYCWGENEVGQLGTGSAGPFQTFPQHVASISGAATIAGGGYSDMMVALDIAHTCVTQADGSASCWGINDDGQLGDGTTTSRGMPAAVPGLTGATKIILGAAHTCALVDGAVSCWGRNDEGQLGDGTLVDRTSPTPVLLP